MIRLLLRSSLIKVNTVSSATLAEIMRKITVLSEMFQKPVNKSDQYDIVKRGAVVELLEQLGYGAESEFEAGLYHATTGKLSLSIQQ